MKYFVYAFIGLITVMCITFLVVNYPNGIDVPNSHFHLDVLITSANKHFSDVVNNDFISTMREMTSKMQEYDIPLVQAFAKIIAFGQFLWEAIFHIFGLISGAVGALTTPCIY